MVQLPLTLTLLQWLYYVVPTVLPVAWRSAVPLQRIQKHFDWLLQGSLVSSLLLLVLILSNSSHEVTEKVG